MLGNARLSGLRPLVGSSAGRRPAWSPLAGPHSHVSTGPAGDYGRPRAPHDPSGRHTCAPRPFGAAESLWAASGVALGRRTRARVRRTRARREEEVHLRHYRADTASSTYPLRIYYGFEAVARGHGARESPTSLGPAAPHRPFRGGTHPGTLRFLRGSTQNYAGKVAQQLRHMGVPLDRP